MRVDRDLMKVMRTGAALTKPVILKQNYAGIILGICLLLALAFLIFGATFVNASDKCQDPNTLTPQMKKAYYELKKASEELGGFRVSIKCYEK